MTVTVASINFWLLHSPRDSWKLREVGAYVRNNTYLGIHI
jgi:hypothetical protein